MSEQVLGTPDAPDEDDANIGLTEKICEKAPNLPICNTRGSGAV